MAGRLLGKGAIVTDPTEYNAADIVALFREKGAEVFAVTAHLRRQLIEELRFARDSPLEADGFELPVPRLKSREFPQHSGRRLLF